MSKRPPPGALRLQEKLHRRSKHAFAPDDEEEEDPAVRPPESQADHEIPGDVTGSPIPVNPQNYDIWSFPIPGENQSVTGLAGGESLGSFSSFGYPLMNYDSMNAADLAFGEQDMRLPLDPFDLQLNAYTDINAPQY